MERIIDFVKMGFAAALVLVLGGLFAFLFAGLLWSMLAPVANVIGLTGAWAVAFVVLVVPLGVLVPPLGVVIFFVASVLNIAQRFDLGFFAACAVFIGMFVVAAVFKAEVEL